MSRPVVPEPTIDCIDCGGRCHLISFEPEDGFRAGDHVVYRCEDCHDRWDLLLPTSEDGEP